MAPADSKGCMLHKPFDVAVFQGQIFVGVTQGITLIDQATGLCEQVRLRLPPACDESPLTPFAGGGPIL